jgi:hypothetical protein
VGRNQALDRGIAEQRADRVVDARGTIENHLLTSRI